MRGKETKVFSKKEYNVEITSTHVILRPARKYNMKKRISKL